MAKWSEKYDCCQICKTTEWIYQGHGLCYKCRKECEEQWRQEYPKSYSIPKSNREALNMKAAGSYTAEDRESIFKLSDYKCLKCGTTENLTIDHIMPLSKRGKNSIDNLQSLCGSCNSKKHNSNSNDYRSDKFKQFVKNMMNLKIAPKFEYYKTKYSNLK